MCGRSGRCSRRPSRPGIRIEWALETHAHADHLSGSPYVKAKTGARIGIGENIREVQRIFRPVFNATDLKTDGSDFDRLFADGERFAIGGLEVEVIHTPGHTPACISYKIGDAVFVGDTLFMPDYGTARADFPGGDAARALSLHPADPRPCRPKRGSSCVTTTRRRAATTTRGRRRCWSSAQRNVHVGGGVSEEEFVAMRNARDAKLSAPTLLLPSIQVNIRAGHFPAADANGVRYLKIPVKFKDGAEVGAATEAKAKVEASV